MRFSSIFDEPIRRLEKEFFGHPRRSDSRSDSRSYSRSDSRGDSRSDLRDRFSWSRASPPVPRPELLDRREYSESVESRVDDEEILKNAENELVLRISCIEFRPEEITVTVEDNHQLLIEGMQERVDEHGKARRQFSRKIQLPDDSLTKEMNCTAKPNGLLIISIPRKPKNEKIIPIRLESSVLTDRAASSQTPSTSTDRPSTDRPSTDRPSTDRPSTERSSAAEAGQADGGQ